MEFGAALCLWTSFPGFSMAENAPVRGNTIWSDQHPRNDGVEPHMRRALACYRNGDLNCAVTELDRARAIRPHDPQIRFMLGNAHYRKRDWRAAITQYVEAARLRPEHSDTYLNLGFSYYHSAEPADAVAAWDTAVKRSPHDSMARMALAIGLSSAGRQEEALSHLSLALNVRPESCEHAELVIDIRWAGDALAQVERLCRLLKHRWP